MTDFLEVLLRGLGSGSVYALLALGFVIIYKSTGVISFAQPAMMLTGATITSYVGPALGVMLFTGFSFFLSMAIAALLTALLGLVIERGAIRPMVGRPAFVVAIITIGIDIAVRVVTSGFIGLGARPIPNPWGLDRASFFGLRVQERHLVSIVTLLDYVDYLRNNQLQYGRQVVALWRKLAYPFTLLVMITIAAPIGLMQTRRGGVGAKVFIGILLGVGFFMLNQLALNVGMLGKWPPWLTALGPNIGAMALALGAMSYMEYRHTITRIVQQRWPWSKSPA